jgi:hypothetical protein
MALGQSGLDGGLALQQPVQRGVELVFIDRPEVEQLAQTRGRRGGRQRTRGRQLGRGIEDPADQKRKNEVAPSIAIRVENTIQTDLAGSAECGSDVAPCGRLRVTVKASRSAAMTVPPLSTPRSPSMWAVGQSDRLQRVRLRTLPCSR